MTIQNKLFSTFKLLLGKGRTFNLLEPNINNISKSFLKPFEELIRIFHKIAFTPFVSQNIHNTDNEQLQDIINFENQFGISTNRASITERANNIEAQFGLVGGQSWEYLQNSITNAGINARVVENIPVQDLLSLNLIQYGSYKEYGFKRYGSSGFILIGNGNLQIKNENKDPVIVLNSDNCFLIESSNGGILNITGGQLDILTDLILRIKPLEKVALLNLNIV